jgi:hypothetical protein
MNRVRSLGLLVAALTVASLSSSARAYEIDSHLSITFWLAEMGGVPVTPAYELAMHDQGVDDNPNTEPIWDWNSAGVQRREQYHFVNKVRLEELRTNALKCSGGKITVENFRRVGEYLHALEDAYAHRSFGPKLGHALSGHTPDKPWSNPAAYVDMVEKKFEVIQLIRDTCIKDSKRSSGDIKQSYGVAMGLLKRWKEDEYTRGVGDPGDESRWNTVLRELFQPSYDVYVTQRAQKHKEWVGMQKGKGWWKP